MGVLFCSFPPCSLADLDSRSLRVTRVMFFMIYSSYFPGVDTSWLVTTQRLFFLFFLFFPRFFPINALSLDADSAQNATLVECFDRSGCIDLDFVDILLFFSPSKITPSAPFSLHADFPSFLLCRFASPNSHPFSPRSTPNSFDISGPTFALRLR
jgi:hypothetical protein